MALKPVINKLASPLRVPFLSYITEVVFAALVFIVFLLATWGLHYIGNALVLQRHLGFQNAATYS